MDDATDHDFVVGKDNNRIIASLRVTGILMISIIIIA